MAEETIERQHLGVVAAAIDLEVGSAGQRSTYVEYEFAGSRNRNRDLLYREIFLAAQNSGGHRLVGNNGHRLIFSL